MANSISAILTGDIVNSTRIGTRHSRALISALETLFGKRSYEFYRGDSFQIREPDPAKALRLAMQCRVLALKIKHKNQAVRADIRISIGLGKTGKLAGTPGLSSGEAFLLSGRSFDQLTAADKRLSIAVSNPLGAAGLAVIADYTDAVFREMTINQAALYEWLLTGTSQQDAAKKLKKSKSTVHQYAVSGRWRETEQILLHYENIVKLIT
ncbi:MAG TPA: hypothetical protein PLQ65_12770 [Flavihumibacter sp.]|nr:hypothetical protein [Bacteroidota bacterium]HOA38414.1 hypothetical protein [Flavihumibacter sp.]HQD10533.1 hypothetical protein [Flavihumibacter sp.]